MIAWVEGTWTMDTDAASSATFSPTIEAVEEMGDTMRSLAGAFDEAKRAALRLWNRVEQRRLCGQEVRDGSLAWWPPPRRGTVKTAQVGHIGVLGYFAGFRDRRRGRHWDRRPRYRDR